MKQVYLAAAATVTFEVFLVIALVLLSKPDTRPCISEVAIWNQQLNQVSLVCTKRVIDAP